MRKRFVTALLMMLPAVSILASNSYVLYNANVIDAAGGSVMYNQTVKVSDGKIVSVTAADAAVRKGEMDMTGKFIMPGLIDSHVHFANACKDAESARALAQEFLRNGVTTVRDVGGNALFIKEYDRLRGDGAFSGPKVYYSSIWAAEPFHMPAVHAVGADSENTPWSRMFSIKDSTDIALEKAVREAYEAGCTGFKLYINYSAEDLARLIPIIRKYGMKVWGHASQVNGADALQVASSGMDVMSHAYMIPRNYYPKKDLSPSDREYVAQVLDVMRANDVVLDMTVWLSYGSRTFFAAEVSRMAYEKGVRFVVGTDLPGCEIHNEIHALSKECGIPNADIIRAATVTAAGILGREGSLGVIREGAEADMLVLDDNPLEDLSALRDVSMTFADGEIVYRRPSVSGSMTLYNCNVVDTSSGKVRRGRTIQVTDGVITAVKRASAKALPGELDMTGKFVMPGMIDSHVHWGKFSQTDELSRSLSRDFLAAGVTTVRDMGSNYLNIREFNRGVRCGRYDGPRVFYSALWAAGNYFMDPMDSIGWEGEGDPAWSRKLNIPQYTDEELEKAVIQAKALGCTGFKLYINYSAEDLRRVIPIMKKHGMKVWSHASQVRGADALQVAGSGVDAVSHAYMLCDDITSRDTLTPAEKEYLKKVLKTLRRNGVVLDATAHISMYEGEMQYCREIIRMACESGVRMVVGTDFFGCAMYDELCQLRKCGMKEKDILRAATVTAAEVLGEEGHLGVVQKGAAADMLILDGNPFSDISVLSDIRNTIIDGRIVYGQQN